MEQLSRPVDEDLLGGFLFGVFARSFEDLKGGMRGVRRLGGNLVFLIATVVAASTEPEDDQPYE